MRLPSFGIVRRRDAAALAAALTAGLASPQAADAQSLVLLGVWADPNRSFAEGFSEIVAYDPSTEIVFSTNGEETRVDRIDISDPSAPMLLGSIDFSAFGGINSVAFKNGVGVAALEASTVTDPGSVVFFDAAGNLGQAVTVGALPDMVTFNRAGNRVLVANEGEPDGGVDPEGSVSVIDIATGTGLGDPALTATGSTTARTTSSRSRHSTSQTPSIRTTTRTTPSTPGATPRARSRRR